MTHVVFNCPMACNAVTGLEAADYITPRDPMHIRQTFIRATYGFQRTSCKAEAWLASS